MFIGFIDMINDKINLLDIISLILDRLDRIDNRITLTNLLSESIEWLDYSRLKHKDIVWIKNKLIKLGEDYDK